MTYKYEILPDNGHGANTGKCRSVPSMIDTNATFEECKKKCSERSDCGFISFPMGASTGHCVGYYTKFGCTPDRAYDNKLSFYRKVPMRICCKALTASCVACASGMSKEKFCSENPGMYDCPRGPAPGPAPGPTRAQAPGPAPGPAPAPAPSALLSTPISQIKSDEKNSKLKSEDVALDKAENNDSDGDDQIIYIVSGVALATFATLFVVS